MSKETETIDRLFLELAQFTSANTPKEVKHTQALEKIRPLVLDLADFTCLHDPKLPPDLPVCSDCPLGGIKLGIFNACGLDQAYPK